MQEAKRRLPRGGRGSQHARDRPLDRLGRRLPRGGRGSQLRLPRAPVAPPPRSPPARGAWIATPLTPDERHQRDCRLPRGGRGSQPTSTVSTITRVCRLPRGGRGSQHQYAHMVGLGGRVASRAGGVDRNLEAWDSKHPQARRLPRGGRGSQLRDGARRLYSGVASRAGGVDRNCTGPRWGRAGPVASRAGGVDRNTGVLCISVMCSCRLPRGGRGSQPHDGAVTADHRQSPPARGAWIATRLRRD